MTSFYRYPYYRGTPTPPPHPPVPAPKPCPTEKCKPPVPKKKLDFKTFKNNTCKSLNDVEHFLCNFSDFVRYIRLINLLK